MALSLLLNNQAQAEPLSQLVEKTESMKEADEGHFSAKLETIQFTNNKNGKKDFSSETELKTKYFFYKTYHLALEDKFKYKFKYKFEEDSEGKKSEKDSKKNIDFDDLEVGIGDAFLLQLFDKGPRLSYQLTYIHPLSMDSKKETLQSAYSILTKFDQKWRGVKFELKNEFLYYRHDEEAIPVKQASDDSGKKKKKKQGPEAKPKVYNPQYGFKTEFSFEVPLSFVDGLFLSGGVELYFSKNRIEGFNKILGFEAALQYEIFDPLQVEVLYQYKNERIPHLNPLHTHKRSLGIGLVFALGSPKVKNTLPEDARSSPLPLKDMAFFRN